MRRNIRRRIVEDNTLDVVLDWIRQGLLNAQSVMAQSLAMFGLGQRSIREQNWIDDDEVYLYEADRWGHVFGNYRYGGGQYRYSGGVRNFIPSSAVPYSRWTRGLTGDVLFGTKSYRHRL